MWRATPLLLRCFALHRTLNSSVKQISLLPGLCSISLLHSFVELSITNCAEKLLHWGRSQCTSWQYRHQWKSEKWKSELWTWHALWKSTLGEIVGIIIIGDIACVCPSKCIFVSLHTSTFVFSYYYRCIIEGGIIAACVQSQAERISSPSTPRITYGKITLYPIHNYQVYNNRVIIIIRY